MNAGIFSRKTRRSLRNPLSALILWFALVTLGGSLVHAGNRDIDRITQNIPGPGFGYDETSMSADGNRIVFAARINPVGSNGDGNREVFVYTKATKSFRQVTDTFGSFGFYTPVISADGNWIAFSSNQDLVEGENWDGSYEIFLESPPKFVGGFWISGKLSQITHSATQDSVKASINADGSRIAFQSSADLKKSLFGGGSNSDLGPEVFLYDRAGDSITQVTFGDSTLVDPETSGAPRINAAGDILVYLSTQDLESPQNADRSSELFWHHLQSGVIRQITNHNATYTGLHGGHSIDGVGNLVVDACAQKDDAILQQPAVDVVNAFFAATFFDDVGNVCHRLRNSVFVVGLGLFRFVVDIDGGLGKDVVDEAVFLGLYRVEKEVAIRVLGDLVDWLPGVVC